MIEQGQIYMVKTYTFAVNQKDIEYDREEIKRKVLLQYGEYIEIRYPYAWHFRTIDNHYFQVGEKDILANCTLIGKVKEDIKWQNQADLRQILDNKMYDQV